MMITSDELSLALARLDKEKAKKLIEAGADINYRDSNFGNALEDTFSYIQCENIDSEEDDLLESNNLRHNIEKDKKYIKTIKLALELGFDVNAHDGLLGSDVLGIICYIFCSDLILKAGEILINAGARNVVDPEDNEDALECIGTEASYNRVEGNIAWADILDRYYEMVKSTGADIV